MDAATQPFLPADATWVGVMLLVAAGLFLAAAVVGVIGRTLSPEAYADMGPQDEPPEPENESEVVRKDRVSSSRLPSSDS